jgi:hypothetical protein
MTGTGSMELGLFRPAISSKISPNYDSDNTTNKVYTDFACTMIDITKSLDDVFAWSNSIRELPGPSWAPDWTSPFHRNHVRFLKRRCASGQSEPQYRFSDDRQLLICNGLKVDTIDGLSNTNYQIPGVVGAVAESNIVQPSFQTS